eukprot:12745775-Alexandrium_andersonii.AAC.1
MRTGSESVDGTGVGGSASPSKGSRQQGRGSSAGPAATGSGCLPPTASRGIARRAPPVSAATPSSWLPGLKPCPVWAPISAARSGVKPATDAVV